MTLPEPEPRVEPPIPPSLPSEGPASLAAPGLPPLPPVTPEVVRLLAQTRPWVRFLAVLGFISTGFMALAALVVLLLPGFLPGGGSGALKAVLAVVYLGIAGVHFPPALFLHRYASRIRDLQAGGDGGDLERALTAQKSFWRYVGILALVVLCLYALLFMVGLVAGIAALALKGR